MKFELYLASLKKTQKGIFLLLPDKYESSSSAINFESQDDHHCTVYELIKQMMPKWITRIHKKSPMPCRFYHPLNETQNIKLENPR